MEWRWIEEEKGKGRKDGIPVAVRKGDVDNKRWIAGSCEKINPVQASSVLLLPWSGLACAAAGRGELGVLENLKVGPDTSRLAASNSPQPGPCSPILPACPYLWTCPFRPRRYNWEALKPGHPKDSVLIPVLRVVPLFQAQGMVICVPERPVLSSVAGILGLIDAILREPNWPRGGW